MCAFVQNPPTVGLKWTSVNGSSPLGIVLSNHSPEIAANNANKRTALDCGKAEILKEWVRANTNPSEAQQSKQVGSGKEPAQVEHTQTGETIEHQDGATTVRKREEMQVCTDEGASVRLQRGIEEGNNADGTKFFRLAQNVRVQEQGGASMQAAQSIEVNGQWASLLREMRDGNLAVCNMVLEIQAQSQKIQAQTQLQTQQMQVQNKEAMEKIKSIVINAGSAYESKIEKMQKDHHKQISDAKEHCRSLEDQLGICRKALEDQVKREEKFDRDHAKNCRNYDKAINSLIARVANLEEENSMNPTSSKPTSSKTTSSKPTSRKDDIRKTQMTVEQVAEECHPWGSTRGACVDERTRSLARTQPR